MFLETNRGNNAPLDSLFPKSRRNAAAEKTSDELVSSLISTFERAIEQGMAPLEALGEILCWAGAEVSRTQLDSNQALQRFKEKRPGPAS